MDQDEEIRIIAKIQKLLELGSKNTSTEEAQAALAKANELMTQYNITNAKLEAEQGKVSGKREQARTDGAFYTWKKELWEAVAKLNFCLYWTSYAWVEVKPGEIYWDPGRTKLRRKQHQIVGRSINVIATKNMAGYLEQAIERHDRQPGTRLLEEVQSADLLGAGRLGACRRPRTYPRCGARGSERGAVG